jgi:hypothetical protein
MRRELGAQVRVFVAVLVMAAVAVTASPIRSTSAAAAEPGSPIIEDFAYPGAAEILATSGIRVISGDGNFLIVDCPTVSDYNDDLIRLRARELDMLCFRVRGPLGHIALEIPHVYQVETAAHRINATLRRLSDESIRTSVFHADDANCPWRAFEPRCFNPVGEADGGLENAAVLLEMHARLPSGMGSGLNPAPVADHAVGWLVVGDRGRAGSRGCSATLIAQSWVLTAKSCFGASVQLGPPTTSSMVALGGQLPRRVVHLVPRPDRDVVLAMLDVAVEGIQPVGVASQAPTLGQALQAKGVGRTPSVWVPEAPGFSNVTVAGVTASTVSLSNADPICMGDAGGPLVAGNSVLGVMTGSGQLGCLAAPSDAVAGAVAARIDDLSAWIAGEVVYARGYLVNASEGRCADLPWGSVADGTRFQVWDCLGSWGQRLVLHSDGTVRHLQSGKCVDFNGFNINNGSAVFLWPCQNAQSQIWRLRTDGTVMNPVSGRCLDVDSSAGGTPNGALLQIWDCTGTPNQRWSLRSSDGEVRNPQSGKCLEIIGFGQVNGSASGVWDCVGGWNQKWGSAPDGTIRNPQTGRCLDIAGWGTANGTHVNVWDCTGDWNQEWVMVSDGTIRNPRTGKCLDLDITGGAAVNGARALLWDCHGGWNQQWTSN